MERGFFDIKYDYSNISKRTLEKYGGQIIKKLKVVRKPLDSRIQYALKFASNGASSQAYDNLFHLSLIATMNTHDIIIEKNEIIHISDDFHLSGNMEFMDVSLNNKQISLNELMDKTKQGMGTDKFFKYNPWTNNCQYFLDAILKYNNLLTSELHSFLFQDLTQIINNTPYLARKFAEFLTHTRAWISKITGKGNQPIFYDDIEKSTLENDYFRNVMYTTKDKHMQVVYMSIKPREDIGLEIHHNVDQFFRIENGKGKLLYGNTKEEAEKETNKRFLKNGEAFLIPAGTWHNVKNSSYTEPLKLYTIYSPANHEIGVKQKIKP